jgi:hypothetical protein
VAVIRVRLVEMTGTGSQACVRADAVSVLVAQVCTCCRRTARRACMRGMLCTHADAVRLSGSRPPDLTSPSVLLWIRRHGYASIHV